VDRRGDDDAETERHHAHNEPERRVSFFDQFFPEMVRRNQVDDPKRHAEDQEARERVHARRQEVGPVHKITCGGWERHACRKSFDPKTRAPREATNPGDWLLPGRHRRRAQRTNRAESAAGLSSIVTGVNGWAEIAIPPALLFEGVTAVENPGRIKQKDHQAHEEVGPKKAAAVDLDGERKDGRLDV